MAAYELGISRLQGSVTTKVVNTFINNFINNCINNFINKIKLLILTAVSFLLDYVN